MATQESMMMRCNAALDEIESHLSELLGADLTPTPRLHRDREMLRVIQLEQVAKWLSELRDAERAIEIEKLPVASVTARRRK